MTPPIRWAILGPGTISRHFAGALSRSPSSSLRAIGSSDPLRAAAFADQCDVGISGTYSEILARDDIDAVYIGTVHTTHTRLALAALEAGKAVLCEKPMATTAADAHDMHAAAVAARRPVVEAFKYRFGPLARRLMTMIRDGDLGAITEVRAAYGFAAAERRGRLFDPRTGGGAVLDAGCYPASLAIGVASWSRLDLGDADIVSASGSIGPTGVDETSEAVLRISQMNASAHTSITQEVSPRVHIVGTEGMLDIPNVWGTRAMSATEAHWRGLDGRSHTISAPPVDPLIAEAGAVAAAVREGRLEVPEMTWRESAATALLLESWRARLFEQ